MKKGIAASIALVACMYAAAALLNESEIIFPEISAVALGAWVMPQLPWEGKDLNVWLSPTLAAFTGMLIIKVFPFNSFFMIALALVLVIIQLQLMHSGVFPAIPAAILPILVRANSWIYPISVCFLTGIVLAVRRLARRDSVQGEEPEAAPVEHCRQKNLYWVKISVIVLAVAAFAVYFDLIYVIAPPLIVVFVELTQPNGPVRREKLRVLLLVVLAAFSGVLWLYLIKYCFHLPLWVFGTLSFSWLFLLFRWLGIALPPAGAIALLPSIIPASIIWSYPFQVSLGCAVFVLASMVMEKIEREGACEYGGE